MEVDAAIIEELLSKEDTASELERLLYYIIYTNGTTLVTYQKYFHNVHKAYIV